jgi:hypothetical protein
MKKISKMIAKYMNSYLKQAHTKKVAKIGVSQNMPVLQE